MVKISVVMPSFLGDYPNAASNRELKFIRALNSFAEQDYENKELILVADGCQKTLDIMNSILEKEEFSHIARAMGHRNPQLISKQPQFSGMARNEGIKKANGDVICYLDTDDMFLPGHLRNIAEAFNGSVVPQWIYFDDFVATSSDCTQMRRRHNILSEGRIGTSSIAHMKNLGRGWVDGYGHDWKFISWLINNYYNYRRVESAGYLVCHIPGQIDF